MTNSVYNTLSTIKKTPATIDEPEYMDINADEAEAGSILMSLSQHTKRNEEQPSASANTMSIRHLLDNDEQAPAHQEQAKSNGKMLTDPSRSTIAHRYPDAVKEANTNEIHGHHIASIASPSSDMSTHREPITQQQRQGESYDWQYEQKPSYSTHHHNHNHNSHPYQTPEWTQQRPCHNSQQHPMPQQQPIKKPYHRYDPQQQRQPSLRKHPKIRRSALHVYISYMTYTDLKRFKSNAPQLQQQSYGSQTVPKQKVHPPSAPPSKRSAMPSLMSVHQQHHQPPLTAFLKDTIEPTVPTTPIPKPSLPPIESHRHSTDWSDRHYHSSPPPPQPPAHYRYPYPTASFPTK